MTSQKDKNNHLVSKVKKTNKKKKNGQFCNLRDKEFKVADLNKLNELQENRKRQLNKIRKTIHEQNKIFNKKIEVIKKNQVESLE